jgi:hypothetical protein
MPRPCASVRGGGSPPTLVDKLVATGGQLREAQHGPVKSDNTEAGTAVTRLRQGW